MIKCVLLCDAASFGQVDGDPEGKWTGPTGHVSPSLIKEHLPEPSSENIIFVCGPPGMMKVSLLFHHPSLSPQYHPRPPPPVYSLPGVLCRVGSRWCVCPQIDGDPPSPMFLFAPIKQLVDIFMTCKLQKQKQTIE